MASGKGAKMQGKKQRATLQGRKEGSRAMSGRLQGETSYFFLSWLLYMLPATGKSRLFPVRQSASAYWWRRKTPSTEVMLQIACL
jgi:hypothetical protein